ncbi:MAG: MFS transporter [Nitrosotalea sp.]
MAEQGSSTSILRTQKLFRALWIATTASNIGTSMQGVGAAWLMTSLTPSPLTVALLQTATSLSTVLLALPGGALADVFDRRRLLLVAQYFMLTVAVILAMLSFTGLVTPSILLTVTFLLGLGAAITMPAAMGASLELVPRSEARHAITLGGVSVNIGAAVGPAIGGFIVAATGPGSVFLLNAISFVGLIIFMHRWHRTSNFGNLPPERVVGAMRAALRYIRHSPHIHGLFIRDLSFSICGSALMALLPLLSRHELHLGSTGFGILVGCFGLGAIIGGFVVLPRLPKRLSIEWRVGGAIVTYACMLATLSYKPDFVLLCLAMIAGGIAQLTIISSVNFATYSSAPKWVGIRVLAVHILVFQAGMTGGSVLWGTLGNQIGIESSLLVASFGLLIGLLTITRYRLLPGKDVDMTPSLHWPVPQVTSDVRPDDGPVLIEIEYFIDPEKASEFEHATYELRNLRLRDGAINWGMFRDVADPSRYIETFVAESWAEHLRHHQRVTKSDKEIEDHIRTFHIGKADPVIDHFIGSSISREGNIKKVK